MDNCEYSYSDASASFTSCVCQPNWLVADYECEFVGNTSCLGIPATLSNLLGYDCPNFQSVIGNGLVSDIFFWIRGESMLTTIARFSKCSYSLLIKQNFFQHGNHA